MHSWSLLHIPMMVFAFIVLEGGVVGGGGCRDPKYLFSIRDKCTTGVALGRCHLRWKWSWDNMYWKLYAVVKCYPPEYQVEMVVG